jgi:hypothetical protein
MSPAQILSKNLKFNLGGVPFSTSYTKAALIVFLLFILVLSLARLRRMYVNWSFKAWPVWIFMGFVLALILEGFLLISGKSILTVVLGWKNAPKPLQNALDTGRAGLVKVLGVKDEISITTNEEDPSVKSVISDFQKLIPDDARKVRSMICEP